jgi:hypothetical protein
VAKLENEKESVRRTKGGKGTKRDMQKYEKDRQFGVSLR